MISTALGSYALGHGGLILPPSRNAVDRMLPQFSGGRAPKTFVKPLLLSVLRTLCVTLSLILSHPRTRPKAQ